MKRSGHGGFGAGAVVGFLGGLVGLGGAEFRLPLLIGLFRFGALEAVILNKATSLVVVGSALIFRSAAVPPSEVAAHWPIVLNLLAGSLAGAWLGAGWATRMQSAALHKVIALMLLAIAGVLLFLHDPVGDGRPPIEGYWGVAVGLAAGFVIGVVASLLGVAGGELLIPTIVLLFGVDIVLAGSLSLVVSLPTMITGFARYSRDASFSVLAEHRAFALWLAAGSVVGALIGGLSVGLVPNEWLIPLLASFLVVSAAKVWRHR